MRFVPIEIGDKAEFDALLSQRRYENSWLTFGNLFTWRHAFGTEWERFPEGIRIRFEQDSESLFLPPLVVDGASFAAAVDSIAEAVTSAGGKFRFLGLSKEMAAEVGSAFPGKFTADAKRDRYDYLYHADDLRNLAGRRYHAKRNYVNRFRQENADWQYEPLTPALAQECLQVAQAWYADRDFAADSGLKHEYDAILESFEHFAALDYLGGAIRIAGKVQAFTIGEMLNADTVVVHIEKADPAITGLYPVINQEFCRRLDAGVAYVNREEDMGNAGLRKAKESYYPLRLIEKYELILRE